MPATILGGTLHAPISLSIEGRLTVSVEDVQRNINNSRGLGLKTYPRVPVEAAHPHWLAVVGGGISINDHVERLKGWPGEIWAINGAWRWCKERGIAATFFAMDPDPIVLKWAEGVTKALLEVSCDPAVFAHLKRADVTVFDAHGAPGGVVSRGTTATAAPHLAMRITFFGCESCYPIGKTHAYQHEARTDEILVECGGNEYLTAPDFYIQALELSKYIRALPGFLEEESGGLLRAMVQNHDLHIRWVSESYARGLEKIKPATAA
jgi:hypothetical protein